jgi:hypothetical protein
MVEKTGKATLRGDRRSDNEQQLERKDEGAVGEKKIGKRRKHT